MRALLGRLASLPVLVATGLAMVALHAALHLWKAATLGELLDLKWTAAGARDLIARLAATPGGTEAHLWLTASADMAYPLAYGAFVAGLCTRYGPARPVTFALPILVGAGFDLAENVVQIAALSGAGEVLWLKSVLTPAKFLFVMAGSAIAIALWLRRQL